MLWHVVSSLLRCMVACCTVFFNVLASRILLYCILSLNVVFYNIVFLCRIMYCIVSGCIVM